MDGSAALRFPPPGDVGAQRVLPPSVPWSCAPCPECAADRRSAAQRVQCSPKAAAPPAQHPAARPAPKPAQPAALLRGGSGVRGGGSPGGGREERGSLRAREGKGRDGGAELQPSRQR